MKRMVHIMLLGVIVGAIGFAQTDLQPAAIVRLTKSEPITVKQFRTEVEQKVRQQLMMTLQRLPTQEELNKVVQNLTLQQKKDALDGMIDERLVLQAAERDKITISENEINQQIQQLRSVLVQQLGRQPTDTEFATVVRNEYGLEVPAFREILRRQMIAQKYLMFKKEGLFKTIKNPTDMEILNTYTLTKSQFVRPETVRFSMIQIPFNTDIPSKTKAKELADRLSREIGSNAAKFDEAVVKGQSANSGYQAGDGGYLPRNLQAQQVVGPEFINIAFTLKQGEVSKLIEGVRGYQIIKVTETYDQKNLEIDDIFQLGTRMTVRDYIGNAMLQQRQQEILKKATDELINELRKGNPFQVIESNLNW